MAAKYFLRATKDGDSKGPFDLDSLRDSRRRNLVKDTAFVRADGTDEWVPLKSLFADEDREKTKRAFTESDVRGALADVPPGSVGLGFVAGFFGGLIGLGLVYLLAKGADTKRGALFGFVAQAIVGIGIRIALATTPKPSYYSP